MSDFIEICLRDVICGMKTYTKWSVNDFKKAWLDAINSEPKNNVWEFKYFSWAECYVNCNRALEEMKYAYPGFNWNMKIEYGECLVVRVRRIMDST